MAKARRATRHRPSLRQGPRGNQNNNGNSSSAPAAAESAPRSRSLCSFHAAVAALAGVVVAAVAAAVLGRLVDWGGEVAAPEPVVQGDSGAADDTVQWERIGREACGIFHAPNFLADWEVEHVLALVDEVGGWEPSPTGGPQFALPRDLHGDFLARVQRDPVMRSIEERVGRHTGVPPHDMEDPVALARIRPRGNATRGGFYAPFGLHHDSDTRPFRVRTVLVYLTNATGGRTAFPLCGAEHDPGSTARSAPASVSAGARARRHAQLQRHGAAFHDGLAANFGGPERQFQRQVTFDATLDHPFNDIIEATCRGLYGASADVQRGSALMFDSMLEPFPALLANDLTWHAGCNVLDGEKIILQKFKEMSPEDRRLVRL